MIALALMLIFAVSMFLIKKPSNTVGFRNNNPFNIRSNYRYRKDFLSWDGEKGFLKFYFLDDGLEAGYRLLFYYFKNRTDYPVVDFIGRYAEGDINYINFLIQKIGNDVIGKNDILKLGKCIVKFENGLSINEKRMNSAYDRAIKKINT